MIFVVVSAWAAPVPAAEIVASALARDPRVAAARAALEEARGAREAAGFLRANPTLDASGGLGVQQAELAIAQPLSISGEGRAARAEADAQIAASEAALARAQLVAAADARLALCDTIALTRDAALARAAVERARGVRSAVEAQAAVGEAPEVDAQLARLTEAAAVGAWLAAVHERDRARVELLSATGLAADTELPSDPLQAVPAQGQAVARRSDVLAAETEVEAARAAIARENAAALAPIAIGVWAQWQNIGAGAGPDIPPWSRENLGTTVGPTLSAEVPLWHRNEGGRAAARGALTEATARAERARAAAEAERQTSAARRAEIAAVVDALPPLSPDDADAAIASIEEAYAEGQLSGLEVTLWLERIGSAERAVNAARRESAHQQIEAALAEEWPTLLGASP